VALQESRLSTFLAADRDHVADPNDDVDAFLSGQIVDLQSRLNITNLVDGTKISPERYKMFARLFEQLNLPAQELSVMAENLRLAAESGVVAVAAALPASGATAGNGSSNAGGNPLPLMPQRAEDLGWLGLSAATVAVLQPYVTVLPSRTPVNLNTASVEVLEACIPGIGRSDAQRLVTARARNPFKNIADAKALLNQDNSGINETDHGTMTRFFEVQGRLRIGANMVVERSIVQRDGGNVVTLWRQRSATDPAAMALAATR
jgi:general secretion pathway protein K